MPPFKTLVQLSFFLKYGLLAALAGVGMIAWALIADNTVPPRKELQTVNGVMTGATKITTRRKRGDESVKFELAVNAAEKGVMKLTIPQAEITESQVQSLFRKALVIEFDSESDVYALTANGQPVMSYDNTVRTRHASNASFGTMGSGIAMFGGLFALIGYGLARRKARKLAAGAPAQAQPAA